MADVPAHAATRHLPLMDLRYPARRFVIYLAGTCGVPRAYLAPDLAPEPPGGYDLQLAERALLIRGSRHRRGGAAGHRREQIAADLRGEPPPDPRPESHLPRAGPAHPAVAITRSRHTRLKLVRANFAVLAETAHADPVQQLFELLRQGPGHPPGIAARGRGEEIVPDAGQVGLLLKAFPAEDAPARKGRPPLRSSGFALYTERLSRKLGLLVQFLCLLVGDVQGVTALAI